MDPSTTPASSVPAQFVVEEYTDAENLIRFASFQPWLEGAQPYMVEGRIEHSVVAADVLPEVIEVDRVVTGTSTVALIGRAPGVSVGIEVGLHYTEFRVSSAQHDQAQLIADEIKKRAAENTDHTKTPARVWNSLRGGSYDDRMLDSPRWQDVAANYPLRVREQLTALMAQTEPADRGPRLVLWHGDPGTGKTSALRTLAREWRNWAALQYISDPERLFDNPEYLNEVIDASQVDEVGPTLTRAGQTKDTWRLVAAEDADEFLRADARERSGAALGRVLNLSDGILGQHHKIIFLLSTNQEVGRLHPALVRPGRCLASIAFSRFSVKEARKWLGDSNHSVSKPMTLAELLAKRGDIDSATSDIDAHTSTGAYL